MTAMATPHPSLRATFSREGRRGNCWQTSLLERTGRRNSLWHLSTSPSPLAGEGGSRRLTDEGAAGCTLKFAKHLRKDMTEAEGKLWSALRGRRFETYKFRRQFPIGKYIADFVCLERRLVVEVDGSQHADSEHDRVREAWLKSQDFRVLRFQESRYLRSARWNTIGNPRCVEPNPSSVTRYARATFSRKGRRKEKKL